MTFQSLVLATRNAGKVRELSQMLEPHGFRVIALSEFDAPQVEESATTFVENALLKARSACIATGLPVIADDSGIEVDALNGAPGVYSARFAGAEASDAQNISLLLSKLRQTPDGARQARFRCAAVYLEHAQHPSPIVCQGRWDGSILQAPRGDNGFGYDPVFLDRSSNLSAAQLTNEHKNRVSHRAQAVSALVSTLLDERNALASITAV